MLPTFTSKMSSKEEEGHTLTGYHALCTFLQSVVEPPHLTDGQL